MCKKNVYLNRFFHLNTKIRPLKKLGKFCISEIYNKQLEWVILSQDSEL